DRPAVVLADVDGGQAPVGRKVYVLVEVTAIGRAFAEGAHADAVRSLLLERERGAGRHTQARAEVAGDPGDDVEVHRAGERHRAALVVAAGLSHDLRHEPR